MAHVGGRPRPTPLTQDRKAPTSAPVALLTVPAFISICLPMKLMHSVGEVSLFSPTMNPARRSNAMQSRTARRNRALRRAESSMSSKYTQRRIPLLESTRRTTAMKSRWQMAGL